MFSSFYDGWSVAATATNAVATATKAAVVGAAHAITRITAGWGAAPTGRPLLTLKKGTTSLFVLPVPSTGLELALPFPLPGDPNAAVSAELADGGAAVDGYVNLCGAPAGVVPSGLVPWAATANATDATATATKAAAAKTRHTILGVICGWSAGETGRPILTIKHGTTVVWQGPLPADGFVELPRGLPAPDNTAVSAELGAGGTGIVGYVNLIGISEAMPSPKL